MRNPCPPSSSSSCSSPNLRRPHALFCSSSAVLPASRPLLAVVGASLSNLMSLRRRLSWSSFEPVGHQVSLTTVIAIIVNTAQAIFSQGANLALTQAAREGGRVAALRLAPRRSVVVCRCVACSVPHMCPVFEFRDASLSPSVTHSFVHSATERASEPLSRRLTRPSAARPSGLPAKQ